MTGNLTCLESKVGGDQRHTKEPSMSIHANFDFKCGKQQAASGVLSQVLFAQRERYKISVLASAGGSPDGAAIARDGGL